MIPLLPLLSTILKVILGQCVSVTCDRLVIERCNLGDNVCLTWFAQKIGLSIKITYDSTKLDLCNRIFESRGIIA